MDNPAKWQDYLGTDLPDSMLGESESVFHGMAGDDYFFSGFDQYDQIFIGGSGSDTYRIENRGVMTIADAGNSENDVIFASGIGIGLSSSYSLTVDNRHLVVFDIVSGQSIVAIDWQSPLNKIEKVVLSDFTLNYDDVANVIYSLDNYLGDYSWEEIPIPSFGADSALMNSTIEFYTYLYTETSAPPAPSVNTIAVDNILTMDELNVFSGISGSAETEAEVAAVVVDPKGNSSTFTATANSSTGAWSIAAVDILGSEIGSSDDGRYELSVTAMDFAGNTSEATSAYFLIDTAAPTIESVVEKLLNPLTLNASILGTDNSDDPLFGTSSSDVIYGLDGDDAIIGLEGDDQIIISNGKNGIYGDDGSDRFIILSNYGLAVDNPSTQTGYFGAQLFDFSASEDLIVVNTDINLKYVEEVYASNVSADWWTYDIANTLPSDENRIVFFKAQDLQGGLDGFLYFHTPGDQNIDGSYLALSGVTAAPTIDNFLSGTVTVNTDNVPVVSLQDWIISQYTSYGSLRLEFSNYAALDGGHGVLINSTDTDITLPDGKVIPAGKIVYNDETADLQSIYDAVPSVVDIRIFGSSGNDYIDLSKGPFDAAKLFWSEGQDYLKGNDQTQLRLVSHDGALTINLSDEPLIIESGNNRTEFGSQVLQVIGTAFDDVLIGNELDNRFSWFGNNGDNKVTGGAGQDTFEFEIPEIFSTDTIGTITITDYESGEKIWFTDSNSLTADSFTATYMAGSDLTAIQMTLDGNTYTPVYVTGEFNVDDINVTPKNWYELTLIEEAPPIFTLPEILDVVFGPGSFPTSEFSASFALDTGWAEYSVASEGTYVAHYVPFNDGQVNTTETLRLWTGDVGTVSNVTHLYIEKGTEERIGWLSGYNNTDQGIGFEITDTTVLSGTYQSDGTWITDLVNNIDDSGFGMDFTWFGSNILAGLGTTVADIDNYEIGRWVADTNRDGTYEQKGSLLKFFEGTRDIDGGGGSLGAVYYDEVNDEVMLYSPSVATLGTFDLDNEAIIHDGHFIESGVNLAGVELSGADLSDANLTSANLTGAELTGANLTNAKIDLNDWRLLSPDQQAVAQLVEPLITDTFAITVAPAISGYGNRYIINGAEAPMLDLEFGKTHVFDLSDESTGNHPLLFRVKDAEGNTTILTDEVISTGTRGSDQKIYFTVPKDVEGTIEYYCERHANMGNDIGVTITNQVTDDLFSGSELSEAITAGEGADLIEAGSGEDTIYLFSSEVWSFPYFAQNIISGERLSLAGKTKFASVMDGEEDADTLNLTDSIAGDAFFLHDSYSGLHDSLTAVDDGMGRTTVARAISLETINAGDGDDVIDLTSPTFDMGGIGMTINGEVGDDTIWAAEGDDELYGGDDDDILFGGEGNDILTGGNGADIFEFKSSNTAQTDRITDYTAEDTLKFYLQSGESELSSANLSGSNLNWGNLTVDFGDTSITSFDDLNIAYDYI